MTLQLKQYDYIPQGLLELDDITQLHQILPQPTLLHLGGTNPQPLFISTLLHGNESTAFFAVQALLKKYLEKGLPRSLIIFVGNIEASKQGLRRLPNQPDYNRVWPGSNLSECDETRLMQQVVEIVKQTEPFASIDIHNNTGKNPHYGCINKLHNQFLQLASLFSRTVVFFETPKGVQSMAMAEYCPSITLECGKPDEPHGIEHARDYVDTVMHLEVLPDKPLKENAVTVYHTVARVIIPEQIRFDFKDQDPNNSANAQCDICFEKNFDKLNFSDLSSGYLFAQTREQSFLPIQALDDNEQDVTNSYFSIHNNRLTLTKTVMPAMITLDKKIVRQDCLCYLTEPIEISEHQ